MRARSDYRFSYYPINLWIDSVITIVMFAFMTLFFVWNNYQPYGIIVALIIWRVGWNHFYNTINNLSRHLAGKPSIELTEDYFIDHTSGKKIHWKNVSQIRMKHLKSKKFVCFDLKDLDSYVSQSKSLVDKFLYKLKVHPEDIFIKTEISLVDGKNEEIFGEINWYFHHKAAHNSRCYVKHNSYPGKLAVIVNPDSADLQSVPAINQNKSNKITSKSLSKPA